MGLIRRDPGRLGVCAILGKLADTYGRKRVLLITLMVYFIAVFLTSMAPTFPILVMLRAIQGIGLSINPIAVLFYSAFCGFWLLSFAFFYYYYFDLFPV